MIKPFEHVGNGGNQHRKVKRGGVWNKVNVTLG
jgi:hypothetical protein